MSEQRKVHCCASVDRPYASVRDALHRPCLESTPAAAVHMHSICDREDIAGLPAVTRVALDWEHAEGFPPVPVTSAEIYASPLSASETQLEIEGHVTGAPDRLGAAEGECDRAAEVSIQALLAEVIERLRRDIDPQTDGCAAT